MIIGNPITMGGGGASLNIDYGTSAPADTSKLWVPLASKPNNVEVDLTVPFGNEYIGLVGSMGNNNGNTTGAVVDGTLYLMAGGSNQSYMPYIYRFNKSTGALEDTGHRLPASFSRSSAMAANGSIYIVGGVYSTAYQNSVYKYTPSTGAVTKLSNLPRAACKIALAKHNGKIYFFGGLQSSSPSNYYGYIDTADDSVVSLGTNASIQKAHAAAGSWGEYIYFFGGSYGTSCYDSIIRYDVSANTFTTLSVKLPRQNAIMGYAQYGQYIYLFGGQTYTDGTQYSDICRFNCMSETSETIATTIPIQLSYPYAYADGNSIYLWDGAKKVIYEFVVRSELAPNKLYIQHDYYSDAHRWLALSGKDVQVKMYPINAFLGNSEGIAEKVNAYLYYDESASWVSLDGVSVTADMLNALATLGVV